jgi:hypothetical protein
MSDAPFVSRRLSLLPSGRAVVFEVDAPAEGPRGRWRCAYRIRGVGRSRAGRVEGDDGIHALQLALARVRRELEPYAARLTWAGEPGELGLTESVPDYFGGAFRRRVEALVRRETEAEARRLRAAVGDGDGTPRYDPDMSARGTARPARGGERR